MPSSRLSPFFIGDHKSERLHSRLWTLEQLFKRNCQSEIWLEIADKKMASRTLPTHEVVNVTRRVCPPDVLDTFYKEWHLSIGQVASLNLEMLNEIAID